MVREVLSDQGRIGKLANHLEDHAHVNCQRHGKNKPDPVGLLGIALDGEDFLANKELHFRLLGGDIVGLGACGCICVRVAHGCKGGLG